MTTTVSGLFASRNDASDAVSEIKSIGILNDDISIVTNKTEGQNAQRSAEDHTVDNSMSGTGTTDGAAIGGVLGGGAGLLAGLGALTIPGIGPVLGAGWLLTTAIGAVVGASGGGIIGALVGSGVNNDDAKVYVDHIRSGGTLVAVRAIETDVPKVEAIMLKYKGMDTDRVGATKIVQTRTTLVTNAPAPTTPAE